MISYLRLLNPESDLELFRESYGWRTAPKAHVQPDRMSFETFAANDPTQIAIGLFNGQFLAVYFLHETEPSKFQAHFTSKRGVPREVLLDGAKEVISQFLDNGATELEAWVTERNKPLRSFLEDLGFTAEGTKLLPKNKSKNFDTVSEMRKFIKYAIRR